MVSGECMKECPQCGFIPTPSNRQKLKLYQKYFPDLPIAEMIKRQWIRPNDEANMQDILDELLKMTRLNLEDFKKQFGLEGDLMDTD